MADDFSLPPDIAPLPPLTPLGTVIYKYPETLPSPPVDKWILFEVKSGRHIARDTVIAEGGTPDRTIANIGLYLSQSALKSALAVNYDSTSLGPFAGAALEYFAQTTRNIMDSVPNTGADEGGIGGLLKDVFSAVKELKQPFEEALKADAQRGIDAVTNDAASRIRGARINPRTDILFDSQQYRTHSLSFTLVPRSLNEAKSIDAIVRTFQYYMLPAYSGNTTATGSFLLGFPYEFEITMKDGNGKTLEHINKIGRSVLTGCTVDHATEGKVTFIEDKGHYYPVSTELTLEFQEVRLLARDSKEITRQGTPTLEDPRSR